MQWGRAPSPVAVDFMIFVSGKVHPLLILRATSTSKSTSNAAGEGARPTWVHGPIWLRELLDQFSAGAGLFELKAVAEDIPVAHDRSDHHWFEP